MRVLRKHPHHHRHHKSVQLAVTTHNDDDNKIPITMGYSDHTRDISNITTSSYNDDDRDDYDAGEEVEEKKGKLLSL